MSAAVEAYKVDTTAWGGSAYYIPQFVSDATSSELLEKINAAPRTRWKDLARRRLQNWGGLPGPKGMVPEPMPAWLDAVGARLEALGIFEKAAYTRPNHCLVNEYRVGQGIMPHEDGPAYYPVVATVSLGDHVVLDLYPKKEDGTAPERAFSLLLEPNSLLILTGDLYTSFMHGIAERADDYIDASYANVDTSRHGTTLTRTDTRVSLTFRVVQRVLKAKILF